jgi:hypothetical protein
MERRETDRPGLSLSIEKLNNESESSSGSNSRSRLWAHRHIAKRLRVKDNRPFRNIGTQNVIGSVRSDRDRDSQRDQGQPPDMPVSTREGKQNAFSHHKMISSHHYVQYSARPSSLPLETRVEHRRAPGPITITSAPNPARYSSPAIAARAPIRAEVPDVALALCEIYLEAGLPMETAWRSALADYFCGFAQMKLESAQS